MLRYYVTSFLFHVLSTNQFSLAQPKPAMPHQVQINLPQWKSTDKGAFAVTLGLIIGIIPFPFITIWLLQPAIAIKEYDDKAWSNVFGMGYIACMVWYALGRCFWQRFPFPPQDRLIGFKEGCALGLIFTYVMTFVTFWAVAMASAWIMTRERLSHVSWAPSIVNPLLSTMLVGTLSGIWMLIFLCKSETSSRT